MKNQFKLALCQMKVIDNKDSNIKNALDMIKTAALTKSDLVILPEMFNCPYDNDKFTEYAEEKKNSKTLKSISKAVKDLNIYIIAGSIPELDGDKLYNSSFIFNRNGDIIGSHRKMHLFDIDIPEKIRFKESETLSAGNQITVIDTELCKIGVAICYDIRFPELSRLMALKGAELIVIPGAFNMTTGPAHWETLIRGRAIDNQLYVAAVSPARNEKLSYVAYGNSMVADPWGKVLARAGEKEEVIYADINLSRVKEIREELPLLNGRREDIYSLIKK
ncbi:MULTISPECIES: carbon-nitrogen hydrolase family protein [Methanobacterium]|uniref:Carbon-nitrogen hydrolase family protein n=1 Tax=Methanobacterium veterum TaxID=408577 RepID=A0A9E5A702_9EURY|nr:MULTISPECIES: carbon-nitrogen hydrolase family protein [Methanobacterium]MCZ3367355.1 carbon-nitrogen hydrolase family protein [Methanobacterium veterum]MCZ3373497.1 carbon-nitrogen hydrolase family protein [Methanobacterium veterum]